MEYPVENVRNITVGNGIKRFRIFSGEDDWTKYNHVKYLIAAFNLIPPISPPTLVGVIQRVQSKKFQN